LFLRKPKSKWSGPFMIKEIKPYGAIEIEDLSTKKSWIVNGQCLKSCLGRDFCTLIEKVELEDAL